MLLSRLHVPSIITDFLEELESKARARIGTRDRFEDALVRAHAVQKLGFDMGFAFLTKYPDAPLLEICIGRFRETRGIGIGFDIERADSFGKALSEVIERALWQDNEAYWKPRSFKAPLSSARGAIQLEYLSGYSHAERRAKKCEYADDSEFLWTEARKLDTMERVYVPTQMISGKYARENHAEPRLREPNSNGLATAGSFEEAAYRGLSELIERDSFMITYLNRITPPRIDPDSILNPTSRTLLADLKRFGLENDLMLFPTDMPLTVVCSIIRDPSGVGPALTLGMKAHHDPEQAVRGALIENLGSWTLARYTETFLKPLPQEPWDSLQRTAFWGKSENSQKLSWLSAGAYISLPAQASSVRDIASLARAAARNGCASAAIAMSPRSLQKLGIHSVCVISPEMQPMNLNSDTLYNGGARLQDVPRKLGLPVAKEPPNYPHPLP